MSPFFKKMLLAGLIVGTLDISAACFQYWLSTGKDPLNVLPMVASGAFGKSAFDGSTVMQIWGLFFHFVIAFSFTAFFFLLYDRIIWMRRNKIVIAVVYGLFIWAVTNLIIVPLSYIGWHRFVLSKAAIAAGILIVCIAFPLTFLARDRVKKEI